MSIQERIIQVIDIKGITAYRFCKDLGLSLGYLDKRGAIGTDKYLKIIEYFPEISPEWLLTGKGEMLISEKNKDVVVYVDEKRYPLVTPKAVGGFFGSDFSIEDRDIKEYYVVPKFKHKQIDFMIEMEGSSMYPKYNSGDVVACKIINEKNFIQWNKTHLIATKDQGLIVKRIRKGTSDGYLMMVSDNKDYEPFEVPESEIEGVALVVGVIRLE